MMTERRQEPTSLGEAIVSAVAEEKGVDPTELPPLYRVVDSDALDSLFRTEQESGQPVGRVVFHYEGYEVTVYSTGRVELDEGSGVGRV